MTSFIGVIAHYGPFSLRQTRARESVWQKHGRAWLFSKLLGRLDWCGPDARPYVVGMHAST